MSSNTSVNSCSTGLMLNTVTQKMIHIFYYLWMFCVIAFSDTMPIYANLCSIAVMGLCVLVLVGGRKMLLPKVAGLWALFTVFAASSILWSVAPDVSKARVGTVFLLTAMLMIVASYAITTGDKEFLIDSFEFIMPALCVYVIVVYGVDMLLDAIRYGSTERIGEEFVNSNALGMMLVCGSLVTIFKALMMGKKGRIWLAIIPIIIALLTGSRKTLGVLLFGLVFIVLMRGRDRINGQSKNKNTILVIIIILFLAVLYNSPAGSLVKQRVETMFAEGSGMDASTVTRAQMIEIGKEQFAKSPLVGCGIGASAVLVGGSYLHNNYIELLATTGLIGVVLYYGFIFAGLAPYLLSMLKRKISAWQSLALMFGLLLLVVDIGAVSYFTKTTYMMFAVLIAFQPKKTGLSERSAEYD